MFRFIWAWDNITEALLKTRNPWRYVPKTGLNVHWQHVLSIAQALPFRGEVPKSERSGPRQNPNLSYEKQNDSEDRRILRPRIVYACRALYKLPRYTVCMLSPTVLYLPCSVRYTFPDCEAHVRSVSNEPTSGCEARVQKPRHKGILFDKVVQRCCGKGVVVPGWCLQEGAG